MINFLLGLLTGIFCALITAYIAAYKEYKKCKTKFIIYNRYAD